MRVPFTRRDRPATPAQAIAQVLQHHGLRPGCHNDFHVVVVYRESGTLILTRERLYVTLTSSRAKARVLAKRDVIERDCARAGWPFFVHSHPGNSVHMTSNLNVMPPLSVRPRPTR
ncbi:hypothetical protein ACFVYG_22330 [Streptomyces sp. NPDC058256]|uniref:hypothetical protein n=1 Tax=Streptomyces sp. NPDC058256 TaxID=3346408 RepID=UPI0036EFD146